MADLTTKMLSLSPRVSLVPMPRRVAALYDENLEKYQDLSVDRLREMFPSKSSPRKSPVDLTKVGFFQDFMADPSSVNAETKAKQEKARSTMTEKEFYGLLHSARHHELRKYRRFDFRLNEMELDMLRKNGLVVSERLQVDSFAEGYYRTYTDDLPVYITADSILHAWHRSYDAILQDIEKDYLTPHLQETIVALIEKIHELREQNRQSDQEFLQCLDEIEFFLDVGFGLLTQEREEKKSATESEEDFWPCKVQATEQIEQPNLCPAVIERVKVAMTWIKSEQIKDVLMFGRVRKVDFSLFKPRGHYTTSAKLMNYFQAMIWFGTIDFRITGQESTELQFLCVIVLSQIIRQANMYETWLEFDSLLTLLVGEPDSMTLKHLFQLMGDADLSAYCSAVLRNASMIENLKLQILNSDVARQAICGHPLMTGLTSSEPTELPLSFAFIGQRFLIDSYALSKVVFDKVKYQGKNQLRRIPSALDVAFTILQNNETLSEISKRVNSQRNAPDHVEFRDGFEYSSNLAALRSTVDQLEPEYMSLSIANRWLDVLRELSKPSSHQSWILHTSEWQRKQLATQLASWAQLRHDNMLYIKQSYTCYTCCEYPAGFVDPYPEFWSKMMEMAEATASQLSKSGIGTSAKRHFGSFGSFFTRFAKIMKSLESISKKQAAHEKLTEEETNMLKTVMEARYGSGGTRYLGWYPQLFYRSKEDSGKEDYLVADVHTDTPDPDRGDPGCIVNVGVGKVLTAFVIVEHTDGESSMYAGPVYSYYEFTTPINQRLTDESWADLVRKDQIGPLPSWATESFLSRK